MVHEFFLWFLTDIIGMTQVMCQWTFQKLCLVFSQSHGFRGIAVKWSVQIPLLDGVSRHFHAVKIVLAYCSPFFSTISSARCLWYFKHSWPIPPVVVNIKGVNFRVQRRELCSSTDVSSHFHAFRKSVVALHPCTIRHLGGKPWHQRKLIVGVPRNHVRDYPTLRLVLS